MTEKEMLAAIGREIGAWAYELWRLVYLGWLLTKRRLDGSGVLMCRLGRHRWRFWPVTNQIMNRDPLSQYGPLSLDRCARCFKLRPHWVAQ